LILTMAVRGFIVTTADSVVIARMFARQRGHLVMTRKLARPLHKSIHAIQCVKS
jgi:hypothetical protein